MMEKRYAIYGCGGFGCEMLSVLRRCDSNHDMVFVSDNPAERIHTVHGLQVISFDELIKSYRDYHLIVAISDGFFRRQVVKKCLDAGLQFASIKTQTTQVFDHVHLGSGAVLCDFVSITSNTVIGAHFHANYYSYVAHDCIVGDYVTLAPRASVNGNIIIQDDVYIGASAVIKQGTKDKPLIIGQGAIVGMGSVVTKNVPSGVVVAGNPARIIKIKPGYESLHQAEQFQPS